ncbi:MAG: SDR family oxidoreductase [Acetobacteraceae bacterium]
MTVAVVTGAGAGVGRATAREFARRGCDVGLISRDPERLDSAAGEVRALGGRACAAPADVADADAVERAATAIEAALGPIDIWVNDAMATIFAPVQEVGAAEYRRATEVTYLGTVFGVQAALRRMRPRGHGAIINVGSALAYRSVPLQSAYCGAKAAIRGFTDSLRSELLHDGLDIRLSMVHLAAMNTPQFDWALNRMDRRAQPVPPIYEPEVAARAIVFAAFHDRREIWVGYPTVVAIMVNRIAPGFADRYLATHGYSGQLTNEPEPADAPFNLFEPVAGHYEARGRFSSRARDTSWEMFTDRHKTGAWLAVAAVGVLAAVHLLARKYDV